MEQVASTAVRKWKKTLRKVFDRAKEKHGWTNQQAAQALGVHRITLQKSLSESDETTYIGLGVLMDLFDKAGLAPQETADALLAWLKMQRRNSCAIVLGAIMQGMLKGATDKEVVSLVRTVKNAMRRAAKAG
jgi:hypothetical protein